MLFSALLASAGVFLPFWPLSQVDLAIKSHQFLWKARTLHLSNKVCQRAGLQRPQASHLKMANLLWMVNHQMVDTERKMAFQLDS